MAYSTGVVHHSSETSGRGEPLQVDSYWGQGVWEHSLRGGAMAEPASVYTGARVNCDLKGAVWDWENAICRDRDVGQRSSFGREVEVQGHNHKEDAHSALTSGITTAAFFSCSPATPGDSVPATTERGPDPEGILFQQRNGPLVRAHETCFIRKISTHCKDLDHQKLHKDVQSNQRSGLSSSDLGNSKSIFEVVNNERAVMDQKENDSLRGSEQVTNHHNPRSSENEAMGFLDLGGRARTAASENAVKIEETEIQSSIAADFSDSRIGLKLGNCTYFKDTAGVPVDKDVGASVVPVKKQRVSSTAQIPRCQVEGCKLELTSAKDYHRRHKVCAMHSKSPKVIVASLEQRFCQQCSRFHVLAEFDEGKRSCRRRLAGHNERRRKPQPDPFLLTSSGTSIFQDNRHTLPAPGERHYLMQHPRQTNTLHNPDSKHSYGKATWSKFGSFPEHSNLAYQLQLPGMERFLPNLSQPAADKLYMLLQQPKAASTTARSQGVQFLQGSGSLGHGLTLSPSSGLLAGLEGTQVSHRCTGSLDSGCALSLLSSHPWSSKAPSSVSLDVSPKSDLTLEQMIAENRAAFTTHFSPRSSAEFQHELTQTSDKCFSMLPISQENSTISTGMSFPALNSAESAQHQAPFSLINNLDNRAMLSILQGHDARVSHDADSHHMKPTIDLMTLPSAQTRHIRPYGSGLSESTSGQYVDMQSLRFEPSMFDAS